MRTRVTPNFSKLLSRATLVGAVVGAVSFFLKIVPCKILESSENAAASKLTLCKLPNPFQDLSDLSTRFFGISNNPLAGLVLQFLIPFALFLVIFLGARRKAGKVLDLTKK